MKYLKQIGMLQVFEQYADSIYMDQDEFAEVLYFHSKKKSSMAELVRKKTLCGVKLLAQDRVRLFYDVPVWLSFFRGQGINFSCGSRIHGNITATLAGIPAVVIYRDARTRELAEFFELPNQADYNRHKSLYEMYLETDYTAFNRNFTRKFQAFEHFMVSYGISHDLDDRSLFEKRMAEQEWKAPILPGQETIDHIRKQFSRWEGLYRWYETGIDKLRGLQ